MEWDMQDFTEELAMAWLGKPAWSLAEAVFLLGEGQIPVCKRAGYPLPPEFAGNAGDGLDNLIRALQSGKLRSVGSASGSIFGKFPLYEPADIIQVAETINLGNWKNWKSRLELIKKAQEQLEMKERQDEIKQDAQPEQPDETAITTLTQPAIKKIFSKLDDNQWRGAFSRKDSNGLSVANIGEKGNPLYDVGKLAAWLVNKGYYTPAEIKSALEGMEPKPATGIANLMPTIIHKGPWSR